MARFNKNGKKEVPEINTGSMSDIIFMFLFFFMVITTMREGEAKVKYTLPSSTEYKKLDKKNFACIYIGTPTENNAAKIEGLSAVQLNNKTVTDVNKLKEDIKLFAQEAWEEAEKNPDNNVRPENTTFFMRIDGETPMVAVTQVKNIMREVNALKVQYATTKGDKKK